MNQVDFIDRHDHLTDAEQRADQGVPSSLHQDALARIDEDDGEFGPGRAGRHISGELLMAGRIGDDERSPGGGKKPIGDIDRNALLALGFEAVHQ